MKITRLSPFSGKEHTIDIPVTENQMSDWENGALIQDTMPNVPPEQREFIMTGITPEEWNSAFGGE